MGIGASRPAAGADTLETFALVAAAYRSAEASMTHMEPTP